jgi:hypothetical protein
MRGQITAAMPWSGNLTTRELSGAQAKWRRPSPWPPCRSASSERGGSGPNPHIGHEGGRRARERPLCRQRDQDAPFLAERATRDPSREASDQERRSRLAASRSAAVRHLSTAIQRARKARATPTQARTSKVGEFKERQSTPALRSPQAAITPVEARASLRARSRTFPTASRTWKRSSSRRRFCRAPL